jgi:predicted Fe-Mo cluster-binding NifX family protein
MRIAMPVFHDQIAMVMDFAQQVLIVDVEAGEEISRKIIELQQIIPAKVGVLVDHGVDLLICGALSRPFAAMVFHSGIDTIPFITGGIDDILKAYLEGRLADPQFLLPGGGSRYCRRCKSGRFRHRGHVVVNKKNL